MNSHWYNVSALLAVLMIGYSMLSNSGDDDLGNAQQQAVLLGYYARDAIITETAESGTPRVRFAANEVTQDLQDNSITLTAVRTDYLWSNDVTAKSGTKTDHGQGSRWVLNADQARIPDTAKSSTDRIELRGNVIAHSVDAPHTASLSTQSLDVDANKRTAHSADTVRIDIDGHTVNGQGLLVDMEKNHVQLSSAVTMRLAALDPAASKPGTAKDKASAEPLLSLPDLFESDSLDMVDNIVVLKNVRSKSEPFISGNQLRATGVDLTNNQVVLSGAVRLELPKRGLVTADVATVAIRDNRVVHVQLTGNPVTFEHQSKERNEVVRGRGTTVDYDVTSQLVRFTGESWFSKANIEFTSKSLLEYNLGTEATHGAESSIRVAPRKDSAAAAPSSDVKTTDSP